MDYRANLRAFDEIVDIFRTEGDEVFVMQEKINIKLMHIYT